MEYCISFEGRCGHRTWFGQWNLSWNDALFLSSSPQALEKHWIASVRLCGAYLATRRSKQPEILTAHIGQLPGIVTQTCRGFHMSKLLFSIKPLRIWSCLLPQHNWALHDFIVMQPMCLYCLKRNTKFLQGKMFSCDF